MKEFTYYSKGICPSKMTIQINDDKTFGSVVFYGGCPGNHAGINALCKGMDVQEVIKRLENIHCGNRTTSCPSELTVGLKYMLNHWDEMKEVQ